MRNATAVVPPALRHHPTATTVVPPPWLSKQPTIATMARMNEMTARDAKNRFGQLLDAAQRAPVRVTKNGRAVTIMLSVQHYERLRGAAWERLTATMDRMSEEASANNLTDAKLDELLANES